MSWYDQGFNGVQREQERIESAYRPKSFWVKNGESKDLVFVDDTPFCIYEHNPKIDGNYNNQLTCLSGVHDDVVCCVKLGPKSRYYVGYLTGVDCSKWVDKKNVSHQYEMRLVPLKLQSIKKFQRKKTEMGGVSGTLWSMARDGDKSPSIGDDWSHKKTVDMEKMFDVVCYNGVRLSDLYNKAEEKPEEMEKLKRIFSLSFGEDGNLIRTVPSFNYMQILAPKTPKEVKLILSAAQTGPSTSSGGSGGGNPYTDNDDDIPF